MKDPVPTLITTWQDSRGTRTSVNYRLVSVRDLGQPIRYVIERQEKDTLGEARWMVADSFSSEGSDSECLLADAITQFLRQAAIQAGR